MNSVNEKNMLVEMGIIIILTCILFIFMSNNLMSTNNERVNNFSSINRIDMHPLDSLRFKFF